MIEGMLIGLGICAVGFALLLVVFNKRLKEMREKEGSPYQKLKKIFKKDK